MKKPKTPRTIADLKINWTFEHDETWMKELLNLLD